MFDLLTENPPLRLNGKQRLQNLDALKLMSLVLVLCLHCSGEYNRQSVWTVSRAVYDLGVLAIPMFFAVSGFQLLGRENGGYGYSLRKVAKLLKATFLFYLFVKLLQWLLWGETIVVADIPKYFLLSLLNKGDYSLMWFVGGLMSVYLLYPLINRLYVKSRSGFLWLCVGLLLFQTAIFLITVFFNADCFLNEQRVWQTFRIWNWAGYFCLGGLIKRYRVFACLGNLRMVVMLSIICTVFLNLVFLRRGIWYCEYCYDSLPVMLFVVSVFAYVLKFKMNGRFLANMIGVFFPAYLLGDIYIELITELTTEMSETFRTLFLVVTTAVCSVTSGWLLMKISPIRRMLQL